MTDKNKAEAVACIVSAYGDPEAFGEREIKVIKDLSLFPYNTDLFPASSLASRDARIAELERQGSDLLAANNRYLERARRAEALLEEAVKSLELVSDSPSVPVAYQWSGDEGLEGMFDPELRHKNGSKAPDYLKAWLSMFRPFAFASRSNSWGELEKLICIVMRNYVRMAAKNAQARATLTTIKGGRWK